MRTGSGATRITFIFTTVLLTACGGGSGGSSSSSGGSSGGGSPPAMWRQQAYVKASNTRADNRFGWSASLTRDGNTLAVGATGTTATPPASMAIKPIRRRQWQVRCICTDGRWASPSPVVISY
ncbi:MAG: FG-GAP repeat protein [Gammaproteobacteria bacterium]